MPQTRSTKRWLATAGVLAVVLSLAAACGDDDNDNGGSSGSDQSSQEDACAQAEDLKNSITDLSNVDLSEEGTNGLDAAFDKIEQNADDLASTVSKDLKPQVDDLKSALRSLETAIANIGDEGGVSTAVDAVQEVLTTAGALVDKVTSADC
jgi:DNA repair ATPase RecN